MTAIGHVEIHPTQSLDRLSSYLSPLSTFVQGLNYHLTWGRCELSRPCTGTSFSGIAQATGKNKAEEIVSSIEVSKLASCDA